MAVEAIMDLGGATLVANFDKGFRSWVPSWPGFEHEGVVYTVRPQDYGDDCYYIEGSPLAK